MVDTSFNSTTDDISAGGIIKGGLAILLAYLLGVAIFIGTWVYSGIQTFEYSVSEAGLAVGTVPGVIFGLVVGFIVAAIIVRILAIILSGLFLIGVLLFA